MEIIKGTVVLSLILTPIIMESEDIGPGWVSSPSFPYRPQRVSKRNRNSYAYSPTKIQQKVKICGFLLSDYDLFILAERIHDEAGEQAQHIFRDNVQRSTTSGVPGPVETKLLTVTCFAVNQTLHKDDPEAMLLSISDFIPGTFQQELYRDLPPEKQPSVMIVMDNWFVKEGEVFERVPYDAYASDERTQIVLRCLVEKGLGSEEEVKARWNSMEIMHTYGTL